MHLRFKASPAEVTIAIEDGEWVTPHDLVAMSDTVKEALEPRLSLIAQGRAQHADRTFSQAVDLFGRSVRLRTEKVAPVAAGATLESFAACAYGLEPEALAALPDEQRADIARIFSFWTSTRVPTGQEVPSPAVQGPDAASPQQSQEGPEGRSQS